MKNTEFIKKLVPEIDKYGLDMTKIREFDEIRILETAIRIGTFDTYGNLQGQGVRLYLDGDIILCVQQGEFRNNGLYNGMVYFAMTQRKYIGEFVNDVMSGFGRMTYVDGRYYEGHWKHDVRSGFGTFMCPNGTTYEGYWDDGLPNGIGKLTYADGRVEEGIFSDATFIG